MRSFDLTPLFRSTVGFDRLADMLDSVAQFDTGVSYPPYNIERTDENHYRISLAVAGLRAKRTARPISIIFIRALPAAPSSGASNWPRMSRSEAPDSRTGCFMSTSSASCPRKRSPAASSSTVSPKAV